MGLYMDLFHTTSFQCSSRMSTETLHQQVSSRQSVRFSRIPPGPLAALDRAVRKACRLVMDQLLLDLQPHLQGLLSRSWLAQGDAVSKVCAVLERHCELYGRVRSPCREVGVCASLPPSDKRATFRTLPQLDDIFVVAWEKTQWCGKNCAAKMSWGWWRVGRSWTYSVSCPVLLVLAHLEAALY